MFWPASRDSGEAFSVRCYYLCPAARYGVTQKGK